MIGNIENKCFKSRNKGEKQKIGLFLYGTWNKNGSPQNTVFQLLTRFVNK